MTVTIEFSPQEEAWICEEARAHGLQPNEVVKRLVDERLLAKPNGVSSKNAGAIALFDSWLNEAATDDLEEIRKADEEYEELKRGLDANRTATGERSTFS